MVLKMKLSWSIMTRSMYRQYYRQNFPEIILIETARTSVCPGLQSGSDDCARGFGAIIKSGYNDTG
jgi:hypothetical protein